MNKYKTLGWAMDRALWGAMHRAVYDTAAEAVWRPVGVAVWEVVAGAAEWPVDEALVRPHPRLNELIHELRQGGRR